MNTIYLIRHGKIDRGVPPRLIGQTDLPLAEQGREQIHALGHTLAKKGITTLLYSPLIRSAESAEILQSYLTCKKEAVSQFKEISLGDWDGVAKRELQNDYTEEFAARGRDIIGYTPPSGENFHDLAARVIPCFLKKCTQDKTMAIVAHAGVNRVILAKVLGLPLAHIFRIEQSYGAYNVIERDLKGFRILTLNQQP